MRVFIGNILTLEGAMLAWTVNTGRRARDGQLTMDRASVAEQQSFDAERLHVGAGGLFLSNVTFGGPVDLRDAHVDGQVAMVGASVADKQTFDAGGLQSAPRDCSCDNVTFGGPVDLSAAQSRRPDGHGRGPASPTTTFNAAGLHVGAGGLFLRNVTFGGPVDLRDAHVDSQMAMDGCQRRRETELHAERLHVGGRRAAPAQRRSSVARSSARAQIDGQMAMVGASVAENTASVRSGCMSALASSRGLPRSAGRRLRRCSTSMETWIYGTAMCGNWISGALSSGTIFGLAGASTMDRSAGFAGTRATARHPA